MPDQYDAWVSKQQQGGGGDPTDQYAKWLAQQKQPPPVDQYAKWTASQQNPVPKTGNIDLNTPSGVPGVAADDTRVAHPGSAPQDTGILSRIGSSIASTASDIIHHPSHLVTQPLEALGRTFLVPVKGEAVGDVAQGQAANAGLLGVPGGVPMGKDATYQSGQTPEEFKNAALQTGVMAGAGLVGGEVGSRLAPTIGNIGGKVVGRTAANAAAGAILNPTDPLVGAATNVATGEALHHTMGAAAKSLELPETAGRSLYRYGAAGNPHAPQGAYYSLLEKASDSPHQDLGPLAEQATPTAKNPLVLPETDITHPRFGEFEHGSADAGVSALKQLVDPATFERLRTSSKASLIQELSEKFPGTDYSKYHDAYDLLSVYGAQEARAVGHDALILPDHVRARTNPDWRGQDFSEYVALHPDAISSHTAANITPGTIAKPSEAPTQTPAITSPTDGLEERNLGPLSSAARQKLVDIKNTALHSPFDPIREQYPDLTAAAEAALSARDNATHIGQVQTKWVTEGQTPKDQQAFVRQLQADRLNHLAQQDPAIAQNPQFVKNLAQIQSEIPEGFAESDAFKTMAAKHQSQILSQTEPAAANAGLAPDRFANLPNGYLRLIGSQNAPEGTYAEDVGGTGAPALKSTKTTTAATPATGTADAYSPSYSEAVTKDAQDKIVKSAQNRVFQEVAKIGTPIDPKAVPPNGMTKIMFNDKAQVIDDPSDAKITLAVPRQVAMAMQHVQKTLSDVGPTTEAGMAAKAISKVGATMALTANPAAATTHMNTLANVVGSVPEEGKPLNNLVGVAPFGTTAKGIADIASVDRTNPETRALEARLSRIGALRPESTPPSPSEATALTKFGDALKRELPTFSKLNPHDLLFGENGVDKRARLALAQKYIDTYKARFDGADPPDAQLRQFVVRGAGDYVKGAGGALIEHLQEAQMSLFAKMGIARLSNAGRKLIGDSGLPAATTAQAIGDRAATLTRGVGGAAVGLTLLNQLLAGHPSTENEPGHDSDLQISTDKDGKPVYLRGGVMYPLTSTAIKALGVGSLMHGDVKGAARDIVNTGAGLATSAPMLKGLIEGATGRQPYFDRQGNMAQVGHPDLNGTADVKDRVATALKGMTSVGQAMGDEGPTKNPGIPAPINKILGYVAPQLTSTATPGGADRIAKQDTKAFMDDRVSQIYRAAGDKDKQNQIIQDAIAEAKANGMPTGQFEASLRRAQAKSSNSGAISAAMRKFQAQYGKLPSAAP
jgi:hypothetical protein